MKSINLLKQDKKSVKLRIARKFFEQVLKEDGIVYNVEKKTITEPMDVCCLLYDELADKESEQFVCLFLDNQHKLIKSEMLFQGTVNKCSVYPREIIKSSLQCNASALIIAHNHPSGELTPSESDRNFTKRVKQACELMEIQLLDHILIGKGNYYSFSEHTELSIIE